MENKNFGEKFEELLKLHEQLENQKNILEKTGIVKKLSESKMLGIIGIDDNEYPLPTYEAVLQSLAKNGKTAKIFEKKIKQGFNKLLLVPFAMHLRKLVKHYSDVLLRHFVQDSKNPYIDKFENPDLRRPDIKKSKLFSSGREPIPLNIKKQCFVPFYCDNADVKEGFVYYPKSLEENHGGRTKKQIIKETKTTALPGWIVVLVEDLPNPPAKHQGKIIGGRRQLEIDKNPYEYSLILKSREDYQHEEGFTPETWLAYTITHLEETNEINSDTISIFLIGTYFKKFGGIPYIFWNISRCQTVVDRTVTKCPCRGFGIRTAVRIQ